MLSTPSYRCKEVFSRLKRLESDLDQKKILENKSGMLKELRDHKFSEVIQSAFLLPSDEDRLIGLRGVFSKITGQGPVNLKLETLGLLGDPEGLNAFRDVINPYDPRRELAILLLLEIAFLARFGDLKALKIPTSTWTSIADHFGLWQLRYLLEDSIFQATDPEHFALITSLLKKKNTAHRRLFSDVTAILRHHLEQAGIRNFEIIYRRKNAYGIFQKMQLKKITINHISDHFGVRVIAESEEDCYTIREVIHYLWRPFRGILKDFIVQPKPNGYQSLHTTVYCLDKYIVEFQIRTRQMDHTAYFGPASHAKYKQTIRGGLKAGKPSAVHTS